MREILFKAKRKDTGDWVEGCYVKYQPCANKEEYVHGIVPEYASALYILTIDPQTICQYTGLIDKNGRKIWENDVVKFDNVFSKNVHIGKVKYYSDAKPISWDEKYSVDLAECNPEDLEVLGCMLDGPITLRPEWQEAMLRTFLAGH